MNVKLKVRHGKLQSRKGDNAGLEVPISKSRFVIGTADDCQMRVSQHHDQRAPLRDCDRR